MSEVGCPGLSASWLNAWLAAVGATVLSPRLRLRWTEDAMPHAVLCARREDPLEILACSWPSCAKLNDLPIRRMWPNSRDLPRHVSIEAFQSRAGASRSHPYSWTLSSTITDLHIDEKGNVAHGPFDPPVPRGLVLHDRLCRLRADSRTDVLRESLEGTAKRVKNNGLGFDITRLGSSADEADKWIDPVVETLAFFGLALLPVRGSGTDARQRKSIRASTLQRGWVRDNKPGEQPRFTWPAWREPLDYAAVDALLDQWRPDQTKTWGRYGVHGGWRSVKYEARGSSDVTRGFGSQRID